MKLSGQILANIDPEILIKELNENTSLPVISAGGVGSKADLDKM